MYSCLGVNCEFDYLKCKWCLITFGISREEHTMHRWRWAKIEKFRIGVLNQGHIETSNAYILNWMPQLRQKVKI